MIKNSNHYVSHSQTAESFCCYFDYGWRSGTWEGGYQTPNTPGISIVTNHGGVNGGRSFGLDLDVYNGLHYHTNKFGIGPKSNWIKAHHWADVPILIGLGVGLSDGWSEW